MAAELDLDDVAATSATAKAELASLRRGLVDAQNTIGAMASDARIILEWQEEGEKLFEKTSSIGLFWLGGWWADRPWRKR